MTNTDPEDSSPSPPIGCWIALPFTLVLVVLFVGHRLWRNFGEVPALQRPFDERMWQGGAREARRTMIADLTDRVLPGMSRTEVLGLLGKPRYDRLGEGTGPNEIWYHVHFDAWAGREEFLVIRFDATGRVREVTTDGG